MYDDIISQTLLVESKLDGVDFIIQNEIVASFTRSGWLTMLPKFDLDKWLFRIYFYVIVGDKKYYV